MAFIKKDTTIKEYQNFIKEVYELPNERFFSTWDMLANMERFMMRALKGVRKGDFEKTKINLLITLSWLMPVLNRLSIDIDDETWKRFPYLCSYCATCPCSCKERQIKTRQNVPVDESKRPKNLEEFQKMLREIYPPKTRTLEYTVIHMAEEAGEFLESIMIFRREFKEKDLEEVKLEAADLFTNIIDVCNSLNINIAEELSLMFSNNCHVCHNAPCTCNFKDITSFKS